MNRWTATVALLCGCPSVSPEVEGIEALVGNRSVGGLGLGRGDHQFSEPLPANLSGFELVFSTLMDAASVTDGLVIEGADAAIWPFQLDNSQWYPSQTGFRLTLDEELPAGEYALRIGGAIVGLQQRPLENPVDVAFTVDTEPFVPDRGGY